ncbi:hypothetical protein Kisp01_13980, partial [Kineosporia sp. NBRC 101677]
MTVVSDMTSTRPSGGGFSPLRVLTDLRIGAKILILAVLAVVLTVLVGVTGQLAVNNVQQAGERIVNVTAEESQAILAARANFSGFRRYIYSTAMAQDAESRDKAVASAEENYNDALNGLKGLQSMDLPEADRKILADTLLPAMDQAWTVWSQQLLPTASNLDLNLRQLDAYMTQVATDFDPVANEVRDQIAVITEHLDTSMSDQVDQSAADARSATVRIWLFTGLGAIVLIAVGLGIARLVSGPVSRLRDSLVALSEGDLTATADVNSRDEIGQMAHALNDASASLRSAMVQINGTSSTLSDSSRSLNAISSQISANADSTSNQASGL